MRVHPSAWILFKPHHYLTGQLNRSSRCFVGLVNDQPAAFTAVVHFPHPRRSCWREHRTVCLPDFQGVGIGNAMSEAVAALFAGLDAKRYSSTTSHPAMIRHRRKSPLWRTLRGIGFVPVPGQRSRLNRTASCSRLTASFEYIGDQNLEGARRFELIRSSEPGGRERRRI